jgi:3-hydroxyacyl-CoA dehydrogenase
MTVQIEVKDRIAHVVIDNPPVNAVSRAVRQGLLDAVTKIAAMRGVDGVVVTGAGKTFVAGADVTEFDRPPEAPDLPDVIRAIETSPAPWLAAINGAALGAGLEIALGCRWRVASTAASLGLPEVTLGIVPGAGGTVRTPRLIGVEAAVDLVTGGKPVAADRAREMGLIDDVLEASDFATAAADWLKKALAGDLPMPVASRPVTAPDADFWQAAETRVARAAKGNTGPVEALRSIRKATEGSFDEGMAHERATFLRLRASDQAAALRHVFFAERAAPRPPELKSVKPRPIAEVGVVGGGTMGAGIAVAMLAAGLTVRMVERDEASAERGRANVTGILDGDVKRGRLSEAERDRRLGRFSASAGYDDLAGADLVIEAVFEDLDVKRAVFAELAHACRPDAILATNTSYLDPRAVFEGVENPGRLIGLHFFSPANVMKLLEIVPLPDTADEVTATAFDIAKRLAKVPVRAGICDGFIGNRILKLYREQGERLLARGAMPGQIDAALRGFGMAMGVFEVQDLAGRAIGAYQRKAARSRGETPFAPVADRLAEAGRLGRKTQAGWYDYADGRARPDLPPAVAEAIAAARTETGIETRDWSDAAIVDAMILPMIDEAARIVAEGVALRPSDVDLVEVHGYGFPRFRGGPVQYGRSLGLSEVVARLRALHADGLAAEPAPQLRAWADEATATNP